MSTVHTAIPAAVERLRASVDALPEQVRGDWLRHGGFVNARDGREPVADARPSYSPTAVSVAAHIATVASPPTVRLLADLLEWVRKFERHVPEVLVLAAEELASHLTEGSTTP